MPYLWEEKFPPVASNSSLKQSPVVRSNERRTAELMILFFGVFGSSIWK